MTLESKRAQCDDYARVVPDYKWLVSWIRLLLRSLLARLPTA